MVEFAADSVITPEREEQLASLAPNYKNNIIDYCDPKMDADLTGHNPLAMQEAQSLPVLPEDGGKDHNPSTVLVLDSRLCSITRTSSVLVVPLLS